MRRFLIKLKLNNGELIKIKATESGINMLAATIQASKEHENINSILEFEEKTINVSEIKEYKYIETI